MIKGTTIVGHCVITSGAEDTEAEMAPEMEWPCPDNLPLHVAEFESRYNNRSNPDIFGSAIGRC